MFLTEKGINGNAVMVVDWGCVRVSTVEFKIFFLALTLTVECVGMLLAPAERPTVLQ